MIPVNINMFFSDMLVDQLSRCGVSMFCISPGSRSTPLTLAAVNHAKSDTKIIIDERASAFYAAGYARAIGRPAAVICTSGTAGANMYPAIIEAYQSRLPLVVLTADRPEELQDCGANQTIDQTELFGRYARSITIPAPGESTDLLELLRHLNKILMGASAPPVHVNCRFREPLAPETAAYKYDELKAQLNQWRGNDTTQLPADAGDMDQTIELAASILNQKEKGLIVIGPEVPFRSKPDIDALSKKLKWPIVADILSQKRHSGEENIIDNYDLFIDAEIISDNLAPDVILHFGGLPTSKRLNQFLARNKGIDYIKIQEHEQTIDPDRIETMRIVCNAEKFLDKVTNQIADKNDGKYFRIWQKINLRTAAFLKNYFKNDNLTEISLAYWLGKALEDHQALFLSSSMPVRDADTFIPAERKDIIIGANRGVSGIDGVIASACGFAEGCRRPTFLVIGDLAFIHDLNSLSLAKQSKVPIVLLVVNNNGGGIFHFLPIARYTDHFEKYFAAPHGLGFKSAADLFGLHYYHPENINDLNRACDEVKTIGESAVIEITGSRVQNIKEHEEIRIKLGNELSI